MHPRFLRAFSWLFWITRDWTLSYSLGSFYFLRQGLIKGSQQALNIQHPYISLGLCLSHQAWLRSNLSTKYHRCLAHRLRLCFKKIWSLQFTSLLPTDYPDRLSFPSIKKLRSPLSDFHPPQAFQVAHMTNLSNHHSLSQPQYKVTDAALDLASNSYRENGL